MKIVRESLSFERGKDPKEVLGIGHKWEFTSFNDFLENLILNIPRILKTDKIPEDILKDKMHYLNMHWGEKIYDFLEEKRAKIKGAQYTNYDWWSALHNRLKEMGYKVR
jgi:hypothetical protein